MFGVSWTIIGRRDELNPFALAIELLGGGCRSRRVFSVNAITQHLGQ